MANKALSAALSLSYLSKCRHKHGAVLMKNGQVLAAATNVLLTGDVSDANWRRSQLHAEEVVLGMAGTQAVGAVLYVARSGPNGALPSGPCIRCQRRIARARVKRVVHT